MQKISNSLKITLAIIIGVIIVVLIILNSIVPYKPGETIQVNGQSTLNVVPDLLTIYFSVQTSGDTSKEAEDKNSEITSALRNNIIALGFEEDDLKTQNFNIYPEYDYNYGNRKLTGYKATHGLKIELSADNVNMIGDLIDAGTDANASISYINFELSNELEQTSKAEAIKLASQDAKIKAQSLASGFDKKLGKLVSSSLDEFGYSPWRAYTMEVGVSTDEVKSSATKITPSEQEVSAYVNAVYKVS